MNDAYAEYKTDLLDYSEWLERDITERFLNGEDKHLGVRRRTPENQIRVAERHQQYLEKLIAIGVDPQEARMRADFEAAFC